MATNTTLPERKTTLKSLIPIIEWLPAYNKAWFRPDLIAALTVWALLVPEAMAYAALAGLPAEAGLYAAPLALLGYAIFGTSRQLVVGPSSTVAIMSAAVVATVAVGAAQEKIIALSAALAIIVGVLFIISGLLKLGFMADFMSRPVLSGLVVGIAITIAMGQLDDLVGYSVPEGGFFRELFYFIRDVDKIHWVTVIVSGVSLVLLFGLEKINRKIPAALIVVALGIGLSYVLDLEAKGVHIVGDIPSGLPPLGLPDVELRDILSLIPGAVGIVLVAFAESIAAARSYAAKHHYEIDANQEMIGLGVANFGAGMSQGFVTPLFRTLPEAVLGAIVVHAVWHLISFKELQRLYQIRRTDFYAGLIALIGVLLLGILAGLAFAVLLSLLALLYRASNPSWAVLGRVPGKGQDVFGDLNEYPQGETYPGLIIFRFDQQLFFANAPKFKEAILSLVKLADLPVKTVLVDAEDMPEVDTTATDMLVELIEELARSEVRVCFARVRKNVMDHFKRAGLDTLVESDRFYLSVREGVDAFLEEQALAREQAAVESQAAVDDQGKAIE
jgi:MFS superfamily sulfate permease-like transporter